MSKVNFGDIKSDFDLNKLAIGQKKEDLKYLNETQLSIFDAIDDGDGVLNKEEIDALKEIIKKYTEDAGDDNFSLKDAQKAMKDLKKAMKEKGVELKANGKDLIQFLYQLFTSSGRNKDVRDKGEATQIVNIYGESIKLEDYDNASGKFTGSKIVRNGYSAKYNAQNELIEKNYNDPVLGLVHEKYENGKLTKKVIKIENETKTITYEDDGETEKEVMIEDSDKQETTTYKYKNGQPTSITVMNNKYNDETIFKDGKPALRKIFNIETLIDTLIEYDDKGQVKRTVEKNNNGDTLVYGKDGQPLFFRLNNDDTMYPFMGQWLLDKFNNSEDISKDLKKWNEE